MQPSSAFHTIGIISRPRRSNLAVVVPPLLHWFEARGVRTLYDTETAGALHDASKGMSREQVAEESQLLLVLGGDGTLLAAARVATPQGIPILPINMGSLGFLTSCQSDEFEPAIRNLASGDYVAQPRMALTARAIGSDGEVRKQWRALNDFVLHKGGFARVVRLNVFVDDESIGTYAADGVVISTPTGSTAYSLSAGGPVVVPTVESIVITPISPNTLAIRSMVIPADAEVTVEANETPTELLVTVDGQVGTSFVKGEKLKVRRADNPVRIVRFPGATFFERMRVKLGWGGLPDIDQPH